MKQLSKLLTILCFLSSLITLIAPRSSLADTANLSWTYPKSEVTAFISHWQTQIRTESRIPIKERDLELTFTTRLLEKIVTTYRGENLKGLLVVYCEESGYSQLAQALTEVAEPNENILLFLRSAVEFLSLQNPPLDLNEFVFSRSYSNTIEYDSAEGALDADTAGQIAANLENLPASNSTHQEAEKNLTETLEPLELPPAEATESAPSNPWAD